MTLSALWAAELTCTQLLPFIIPPILLPVANTRGSRQWVMFALLQLLWWLLAYSYSGAAQQHEHYTGVYLMFTNILAFKQRFTVGIWKLPGSCTNTLHPFMTTWNFCFYRNVLKKSQVENVVLSTPTSEVVAWMGQETSHHFDGWGVKIQNWLIFPFLASEEGKIYGNFSDQWEQ